MAPRYPAASQTARPPAPARPAAPGLHPRSRAPLWLSLILLILAALPAASQMTTSPEPPAPAASAAVQAILEEAVKLGNGQKPAEALAAADRALAAAIPAGDLPGQAVAHRLRAMVLEFLRKPAEAGAAWDAAGAAWKATGDGPGQVEALARGGLLAPDAARRDQGINAAIAMAAAEMRRPLTAAAALHAAGSKADHLSLPDPARRLAEAALARREALAPGSLASAESLHLLGYLAGARRDLVDAKRYYEQALAIRSRLAPGSLGVALTLHNLGIVARVQGDLAGARRHYQEALAIREKLAPGSPDVAGSLNNLGVVAYAQGDLAGAKRYYEQALAIWEKLAPGALAVALGLNNLGAVAYAQGDLGGAKRYYEQALAIQEKLAPGSLDVAGSLNNLGSVAHAQGDRSDAKRYAEQALAIQQRLAPGSLDVANSLNNLGSVAQSQGDLVGAQGCFEQALAIKEKLAPGSLAVALTLHNLGSAAQVQGNLVGAKRYYEQALAIEERLAPGSLDVADSLNNLGSVARGNGDRQGALRFARQAWSIVRQQSLLAEGDEARQAFGSTYARFGATLVARLLEVRQPREAAQALEESRGQSLLRVVSARGVTQQLAPPDLWRDYSVARMTRQRAEQALAKAAPADQPALRVALLTARSREEGLSAQVVAAVRKSHPQVFPPTLTAEQARRSLPADALFLAFSVGERESTLFLVRKNGPVSAYQVPVSGAALDARVAALRAAITGQPDPLRKAREQAARLEAARGIQPGDKQTRATGVFGASVGGNPVALARELWQRLLPAAAQAEILKAKRLVISPDGPLWDLPFAALVTNRSGAPHYLGLQKPLVYAQSLTLAALSQRPDAAGGTARGTLIIGNPNFTPPVTGATSTSKISFASRPGAWDPRVRLVRDGETPHPLPGAGREGLAVAALYRSSSHTGGEPTEAWFRKNAPAARIIHLATHGFFNPIDALGSKVLLAAGPRLNPDMEPDFKNDGSLTAKEITEELHIRAQLVVLSACETGIGRKVSGEGLIGLTRAWQIAGARSVVASQWQVQDDSTAALMVAFHKNLRAGLAKDEALRRAMVTNAANPRWRSPYHWSPFFLTGDPAPLRQ